MFDNVPDQEDQEKSLKIQKGHRKESCVFFGRTDLK